MPYVCNSISFKTALAASVLLGSFFSNSNALAAIMVLPHDSAAKPGDIAQVVFDLDLGALASVSSFDFSLSFDPAVLSFVGSSTSYNGAPTDFGATLISTGTFTTSASAGVLSATWFALDSNFQPTPPLQLSGMASATFNFTLASNVANGFQTPVDFTLNYSDADLNTQAPVFATTNVVATVPLPQSWVLFLSGLGLVFTKVRTRRRGFCRIKANST